ncbi:MAG: HD domain-containing phosphohydrolase [bacterium]
MASHSILIIDDEASILEGFQRIFALEDYKLFIAQSADKGLEILKNNPIDLIICDQKMPNMSGTEFFGKVSQLYPDIIRIILTGKIDLTSTIDAINKGKIYQYITKPCNKDDLKIIIKNALDRYDLMNVNKKLQQITQEQNDQLKNHNKVLEEKVRQRTEELDNLYNQLKENFIEFIRVFMQLLCTFDRDIGEHCKRVAYISKLMGEKIVLSEFEMDQLETAALLHDIGLISIPNEIHNKSFSMMSFAAQEMYKLHPVIGQSLFSSIESLNEVGTIIRGHHEWYDGRGYPDKLKGENIPKLARIIRVADEYDHLKNMQKDNKQPLSNNKCIFQLTKYKRTMLDAGLVDTLINCIQNHLSDEDIEDIAMPLESLMPGMKISRPVINKDDIVLLEAESFLTDAHIKAIMTHRYHNKIDGFIYVYNKTQSA